MNGWWVFSHLTAVAPSNMFALVVSHLGSGTLIQLGKTGAHRWTLYIPIPTASHLRPPVPISGNGSEALVSSGFSVFKLSYVSSHRNMKVPSSQGCGMSCHIWQPDHHTGALAASITGFPIFRVRQTVVRLGQQEMAEEPATVHKSSRKSGRLFLHQNIDFLCIFFLFHVVFLEWFLHGFSNNERPSGFCEHICRSDRLHSLR